MELQAAETQGEEKMTTEQDMGMAASPEILKWEGPDVVEVAVEKGFLWGPRSTAAGMEFGWHYRTALYVCRHCRRGSSLCRCSWRLQ